MDVLNKEIDSALERGYLVRDRACRLDVPSPRTNSRRKSAPDTSFKSPKERRRENDLQKLARGEMTVEEWERKERRAAAAGNPKDEFVSIDGVRFVGELYKLGLLPAGCLQAWFGRLLFDTVHPEIPSTWELECACALLIITGPSLEEESGRLRRQEDPATELGTQTRSEPAFPVGEEKSQGYNTPRTELRSDQLRVNSETCLRKDSAPNNHWIHCAPPPSPGHRPSSDAILRSWSYPPSGSVPPAAPALESYSRFATPQRSPISPVYPRTDDEVVPDSTCEARIVLEGALSRITSLSEHPDVDQGTKMWLHEVLELKQRQWKMSSEDWVPGRTPTDPLGCSSEA